MFDLFVVSAARLGIDADAVAAEELRPLDPALVVVDRLGSLRGVGIAERAFAIAHDEDAGDAVIVSNFFQIFQVAVILLLVLVKLVDVFDREDAVIVFGDRGELHRIELLGEERLMERPLGERDFE